MNLDPKTQNPAQLLEVFRQTWHEQFGETMPHEMCAGFIAGMSAGLGKAMVCGPDECLVALLQCGDIAATMEQLESMGMLG